MIDDHVDDRLIDAAARAMTAEPVPADVAARVLAALSATSSTRWRPRWRLAAGAVAIAIAATVFATRSATTITLPEIDRRSPPPGVASALAAPADAVVAERFAATALRPSPRAAARRELADIRRLPALAGPAALGVAAIQPERVDIGLLELTPMATEPLAIPRLDSRRGSQ